MYYREIYKTTFITEIMEVILITPFPYWFVILLSGIGTFLSIRFGDELMDVIQHKDRYFYLRHHFKYEMILFVFFLVILFGYYEIISTFGVTIDKH